MRFEFFMSFIDTANKIFRLKDLRNRILFTIVTLLIFRFLAHVPLPGIDLAGLKAFFESNQLLGLLNLFSGGSIGRFSIVMLGVGPYITSSIIFQLLTLVIPSLDALQKEGEWGREKINQYTRWATILFAMIESFGLIRLLQSQNVIGTLSFAQIALTVIVATAGSIFLMWLGELISERGIGNGISILIAAGIIAGIPGQLQNTAQIIEMNKILAMAIFLIIAATIIGFIVFFNEAERRIPVAYARQVRGRQLVGGIDTYLPIKIAAAGVIPIIFAISVMVFPGMVGQFFSAARSAWLRNAADWLVRIFGNNIYYGVTFFVLVVLFTFFYTSIIFQPKEMAKNLQKQGGFVPGIRPGPETADYLTSIIYKVTFAGAVFLGTVAILPFLIQAGTGISTISIGGTGILIIISVTLETMRQIQAQLATRTYEEFV